MFLKLQLLCQVLVALIVVNTSAQAQHDSPTHRQYWLEYGVGMSKGMEGNFTNYLTGALAGFYQQNKKYLGVRLLKSGKLTPSIFAPGSKRQYTDEYAVMGGIPTGLGSSAVLAGPGFITGRGETQKSYHAFGLSIEFLYQIKVAKYAATGFKLIGNLNQKNSYGGVIVSLVIGRL